MITAMSDANAMRPAKSSTGEHLCRIVLTGGPGGGKTTAADMFRREIGDRVVVVPEAATMLFAGGFPRTEESEARRAAQRAIYQVQRNLEDLQSVRFPGRVLLCDRGTVDGGAYWPGNDGGVDFFTAVGTSMELELARYDAVIFFETAAVAATARVRPATRHEPNRTPARSNSTAGCARSGRTIHNSCWSNTTTRSWPRSSRACTSSAN